MSLRRSLRRLAVAVQLLTRFPVRLNDVTEEDLRAAAPWFPVVGLFVAAVGIAVRGAIGPLLGNLTASIAAVIAMVAATGAFHEDGLADTVDGLWGGMTAERRLEIMRDSRIGTYGVVALAGSLLVRVSLLAPLELWQFAGTALIGHVAGRAAGVMVAGSAPPVAAIVGRPGLGATVIAPARVRSLVLTSVVPLLVAAVTARQWFWCPLLAAAVGAAAVRRAALSRLGGLTGDVLGAANQVAHIAAAAALVALFRGGWV